jgi:hypothetical protein
VLGVSTAVEIVLEDCGRRYQCNRTIPEVAGRCRIFSGASVEVSLKA